MKTAFALIKPGIDGECPESIHFGFVDSLADKWLGWQGVGKDHRTDDEKKATIEALQNPVINLMGCKLVRAETVVAKEAAWTLDLDDVSIYYDGPASEDEYMIRTWVARHISDAGTHHALLELLREFDRDLDAPGLCTAIARQIDEAG